LTNAVAEGGVQQVELMRASGRDDRAVGRGTEYLLTLEDFELDR
jgi:hypothetical protein